MLDTPGLNLHLGPQNAKIFSWIHNWKFWSV